MEATGFEALVVAASSSEYEKVKVKNSNHSNGLSKYRNVYKLCTVIECQSHSTSGKCNRHKSDFFCNANACGKICFHAGKCKVHGDGGKICQFDACGKLVLSGGHCRQHGGGKRCLMEDCARLGLSGGLCRQHGGGKRCLMEGCSKGSLKGGKCSKHGGGNRCQADGCNKGSIKGGNCTKHSAKRCDVEGCLSLPCKRLCTGQCALHSNHRNERALAPRAKYFLPFQTASTSPSSEHTS